MLYLKDLESFFDLPANVYLLDFKGNVLECNDVQAKCIEDAKPTDLVGKNLSSFVSENDGKEILKNNTMIHRTEAPKIFIEKVYMNKKEHSYLSYKMPIADSKNRLTGILGTSISLNNDSPISNELLSVNNCNAATYKFVASLTCKAAPLKIEGKNISKREQMCLYYLITGMTAKGIARKLNLSPRTIEYYISRMKEKFNCRTKMELIIKAISAN